MIGVLYVISDCNIGGAGVLLCNLLRHIDRQTFRCGVALPFGSVLRERMLSLNVTIFELQNPCDTINAASVKELCSVICEFDADIVHANAAVSARAAGRICRRIVVHTRHCYYPVPKRGVIRKWTENLGNRVLSHSVIATSRSAAENLRDLGIPKNKIHVILNGSDAVRAVKEWELSELIITV